MSNSQENPLLSYAHYHSIASSLPVTSLLQSAETMCAATTTTKQEPSTIIISQNKIAERLDSFNSYISSLRASVEEALRTEKLDLSREDAGFLSTVVRNAKGGSESTVDWDAVLPSRQRVKRLKVETPLFGLAEELSLSPIKNEGPLDLSAVKLPSIESASEKTRGNSSCLDVRDALGDKIAKEKLGCTRESFKLIQDARECGRISFDDIRSHIEQDLRAHQVSRQQASPYSANHNQAEQVEKVSPPLYPLIEFDDAFDQRQLAKRMLPSPSSTDQSDKPKHRNSPKGKKVPTLRSLQPLPNEEERLWILSSSEVDELELSSRKLTESSPDPLCADKPVDNTKSKLPFPAGKDMNTDKNASSNDDGAHQQNLVQVAGAAVHYVEETAANRERVVGNDGVGHVHHSAFASEDGFSNVNTGNQGIKAPGQEQHSPTHTYNTTGARPPVEVLIDHTATAAPGPEEKSPNNPEGKPSRSNANKTPTSTKRKRGKAETSARKQTKSGKQTREPLDEVPNEEGVAQSAFKQLGGLYGFLETRGLANQPEAAKQSAYFGAIKPDDEVSKQEALAKQNTAVSVIEQAVLQAPAQTALASPASTATIVPRFQTDSEESPILFLSVAMLRWQPKLVQYLETKPNPPTLLWCDYDNINNHGTQGLHPETGEPIESQFPRENPTHGMRFEADIIISPKAGILLTTSQEITQLHLPGHRQSPELAGVMGIDSPLRERVFRLAPRYEQIYVLIGHMMRPRNNSATGNVPATDKLTLARFGSLTAFCSSVSEWCTVTPLMVSSAPEVMGQWVLNLANKHAWKMPDVSVNYPQATNFTSVNKPSLKSSLGVESMQKESNWEELLRQAGMNPFAALITLAVMRRDEENALTMSDRSPIFMEVKRDGTRIVRSLSKFIEMDHEERRKLLGDIVGEKVLKRVGDILDADWHCDWALDYRANGQ